MPQEVNKRRGRLMPLHKYKQVYRVLLHNADPTLVNTPWCAWLCAGERGSQQAIYSRSAAHGQATLQKEKSHVFSIKAKKRKRKKGQGTRRTK